MKHANPLRSLTRWLLMASCVVAAGADAASLRDGFDVQVPMPPTPVRVEGHWQLSYELQLVNRSRVPLVIDDYALLDAHGAHTLATLAGEELNRDIAIAGAPAAKGANPAPIKPGQRAVLFVDVDTASKPAADSIVQRLRYHAMDAKKAPQTFNATLALGKVEPSLIGPPLRGGPWVAIHSPVWPRGHRRVFYRIDGRERLPARFAIDWIKVDDRGRFTAGDEDVAKSWYGYGAEVIAVADASVAATHDGMDEPARISQRTQHVPADDAGNYVTLRLPDGRFAFYEHLQKGSVRVAVGDKVHVGQVLGLLGFSGESTGPHLHFHVADANSPLGAEGVPFEIRQFTRLGRYNDISGLGKPWNGISGDNVRRSEWPDVNTVVMFPDGTEALPRISR